MLSAADLADLRAVAESDLPDLCNVVEPVMGNDGAGGYTEVSTTTLAANVPCRVASISGSPREVEVAGRLQSIVTHTVTLPAETPVTDTSRIQHGSKVYEVTGGSGERSVEITRRVNVVEVG